MSINKVLLLFLKKHRGDYSTSIAQNAATYPGPSYGLER